MTVKKNGTKSQGKQTRKAAGAKSSRIPTSGLPGFLLDSSEAAGKAAFAALAKSRPAFRGIAAAGAAFSLKKMDPESAAYRIMTSRKGSKYLFTRRQVTAMFYIALTSCLSRTSQFSDSRRAVILATRSLFRNKSAAYLTERVKAVEDGFLVAGIV